MSTALCSTICPTVGGRFRLRRDCGWSTNKKASLPSPVALCGQAKDRGSRGGGGGSSSAANSKLEILSRIRERFAQEVSFKKDDKDVPLAKTLLLVAAEDEAFMAINRDMDAHALWNEQMDVSLPFKTQFEFGGVDEISLAGKSISEWLSELDIVAREVEAELVSRDIGCHLVELLEAVNVVLFAKRGFKRFPVLVDSKFSYLHQVLSSGYCSAIMFSIIYIEICQRLGVSMVGSRVGEEFLIWPETGNPEELFKASSGQSLFAIINGRCVEDPRSKASDLDSKSLLELDITTNRDIIGIALANLIRLHWKRASKMNPGLMLTSPLRPVYPESDGASKKGSSKVLLQSQELRLAIMAAERLLIMQPHNWTLRRDYGMLLYYNRRYAESLQELSICMALAPVEAAEVLERFILKLHLLRLESSWNFLDPTASLAVP